MQRVWFNTMQAENANHVAGAAPGWDVALYQDRHSFVWAHGVALLDILAPRAGERVLDLGCGTGQLAGEIAARRAAVVGIDSSPTMVEQARRNFPALRFEVADATSFTPDQVGPDGRPFDAVFSNAVLHWVKPPEAAAARVWEALRPGGRFVVEFGGMGNVRTIRAAMREALEEVAAGGSASAVDPWYFPSVGEYASLLERQGFEVNAAMLFDRPTPLEGGEAGMRDWVRMFGPSFLAVVAPGEQERFLQGVCERVHPLLWREERWWADYRRLRVVAHKPAP